MFLKNKYTKTYYAIIENANDVHVKYETEQHHIIPKSLGGDDIPNNLVHLTLREHFVVHWLLTKMVNNKKQKYQMTNAFSSMLYRVRSDRKRHKVTGRKFELIKKQIAKEKSKKWSGAGNPMYKQNHTKESTDKMSVSQTERWKTFELTDETREKLRNGNKHTGPNYKLRGKNNANYTPGNKERRKKIFLEKYGVSYPSQIPMTCEHCGKILGIANYNRWHGDKCKHKR